MTAKIGVVKEFDNRHINYNIYHNLKLNSNLYAY